MHIEQIIERIEDFERIINNYKYCQKQLEALGKVRSVTYSFSPWENSTDEFELPIDDSLVQDIIDMQKSNLIKNRDAVLAEISELFFDFHATVFPQDGLEELFKILPRHLTVARNPNAAEEDRYRLYNRATSEYVQPGFSTVRELLTYYKSKFERAEV